MKRRSWLVASLTLCGTLAAGAGVAGSFEEGMKAVAAKDWGKALPHLEAALAAAPDNLRYASEYRQAVIQAGEYDRCVAFFEKLVADHPSSANAWLNFGFAYVDKIPAAGSITQVILANNGAVALLQVDRAAAELDRPLTRAATAISTGRRSSAARRSAWPTSSRRWR